MNRREFLKTAAAGTGAALAGTQLLAQADAPAPKKGETLIGMPICIQPLAGGDLDRILADMREKAGVNALFPFIYSHEEHRAGVYGPSFRGGNYGIPHMQYYKDTVLTYEDMRAPEFGSMDVLQRTIDAGKKAGIKVFPFVLEDNHRPAIAHWDKLAEVDFHGRLQQYPCKNNPYYHGWLTGLVEDYARSYEIGGMMWGAERQSGFLNAAGLAMGGGGDPGKATCFCDYCTKKARSEGIDPERARQGFIKLEAFNRASKAGTRPADGHFATFWRLLLNYPELLYWENLWVRGRHQIQAEMHARMKSANPALPIGWHIWQNITFSPFQRGEEDYGVMKANSDFVRPAVYANAGGMRMKAFANAAHGAVLGDLKAGEALALVCRMMGFEEAPYDRLAQTGLSAGYVEHETRRAVEGLAGSSAQVWPGIDIDVPVPAGPGVSHCTPESVKAEVRAVFAGGGKGIILSRNYIEMKPENLAAAGDALRELGLI
ncbi:MAG TPA: twin-arginine translocation signal domain-containing protein [Opitutaceae bacterium]|nr:twin-arginine translocation signal domain-containing protein [Opitutaceae bacterium]